MRGNVCCCFWFLSLSCNVSAAYGSEWLLSAYSPVFMKIPELRADMLFQIWFGVYQRDIRIGPGEWPSAMMGVLRPQRHQDPPNLPAPLGTPPVRGPPAVAAWPLHCLCRRCALHRDSHLQEMFLRTFTDAAANWLFVVCALPSTLQMLLAFSLLLGYIRVFETHHLHLLTQGGCCEIVVSIDTCTLSVHQWLGQWVCGHSAACKAVLKTGVWFCRPGKQKMCRGQCLMPSVRRTWHHWTDQRASRWHLH